MSATFKYFIIHKPYKVLSQFSDENGNAGLGSIYTLPRDVYPVGRLDLDSEGLLILTNDKALNNKLLNPKHAHTRTYLAEVEGIPDRADLAQFAKGLDIKVSGKVHRTMPAKIEIVAPSQIAERDPPVNYKKHPERSWVKIELTEGKNRQVRRMTAAIGHPTLRLVRVAIEELQLLPLASGGITQLSQKAIYSKLKIR
ncbi:MAG: pseudouridine synthase [Cyclobacteriaceae bacterium]